MCNKKEVLKPNDKLFILNSQINNDLFFYCFMGVV
jgi:hypothetical protein